MSDSTLDPPVRKSVVVAAPIEEAFDVFTHGFDSWWPRSHHIGKSPMVKAIVEGNVGGRCYTQQEDGTDCDWGTVLAWEPPSRLVLAWQISGDWQYEPDLARSSEVEVRFYSEGEERTRVELEHRYLSRAGNAHAAVRAMLDSPQGWGGTLALYAAEVQRRDAASRPRSNAPAIADEPR